MNKNHEIATLAGGCFWCTEAIFLRLRGVLSVLPGYSGGSIINPTYDEVCTGNTGHAEAIQLKFDPGQITFGEILDVFWHTHDPTTINRQGNDSGTQYRSAIFYHSKSQMEIALKSKADLEFKGEFDGRIVTEIVPFKNFYKADDYHINYFERNKNAPYCKLVIDPKI